MDAEELKAEIASLEKKRAQAIAIAQGTDGALGFAKYLLAKVEAKKEQAEKPPE